MKVTQTKKVALKEVSKFCLDNDLQFSAKLGADITFFMFHKDDFIKVYNRYGLGDSEKESSQITITPGEGFESIMFNIYDLPIELLLDDSGIADDVQNELFELINEND